MRGVQGFIQIIGGQGHSPEAPGTSWYAMLLYQVFHFLGTFICDHYECKLLDVEKLSQVLWENTSIMVFCEKPVNLRSNAFLLTYITALWLCKVSLTHRSHSFFCPPKAYTVLTAPRTSSAIAPALAYACNSLVVNDVNICKWLVSSKLSIDSFQPH